jgi:REP element-mobilizing transposase RayT
MARPLRIEFAGALYHVTSRGNARAAIFADDDDREALLEILASVVERFGWRCHAYCLMPNHYHLVVDTPAGGLSRGMRQLNGVFTQRMNRRHDRVGHLLQGRFHAVLVERESHLLELARYVVLNPVRAGMIAAPETYRWSSLRATIGLDPPPPWLAIEPTLAEFGSADRYLRFVRAGMGAPSPWVDLKGPVLGSDEFACAHLGGRVPSPEVPTRDRLAHRPRLADVFTPAVTADRRERDAQIRSMALTWRYTLTDLGRHVGLHHSTVSRIVRGEPSTHNARPDPRG